MTNSNNGNLHRMAKDAIPLGVSKDVAVDSQNIYPTLDGKPIPFCPFMEAEKFPMKNANTVRIIRLYHPCSEQCQMYDSTRRDAGLNPCSLTPRE